MPETVLPRIENRPQSYFIRSGELQANGVNVTQVGTYKFGEKVTRDNLIPFFINFFAKTRGKREAGIAIAEWLSIHTGFNSHDTFLNLLDAYEELGFPFSDAEEQQFESTYASVSKHSDRASGTVLRTGLTPLLTILTSPREEEKAHQVFPTDVIEKLDAN